MIKKIVFLLKLHYKSRCWLPLRFLGVLFYLGGQTFVERDSQLFLKATSLQSETLQPHFSAAKSAI